MSSTTHTPTPARSGHAPARRSRWTPLRTGAAVAAGLVVTTAVAASAADLGGVNSSVLGAGVNTVASCDTNGVTVTYANSYSAGNYNVTAVTIGGIADLCLGKTVGVTLSDGTLVLGTVASGTVVAGTANNNTATGAVTGPVTAASVARVAVVIA